MKNFLTKTWTGAILAGMVFTVALMSFVFMLVTAPKAVLIGFLFLGVSFIFSVIAKHWDEL